MRLLFVALFTALIVIAAPGSASAKACGVPQAKAVYETPEVQIYKSKDRLLACGRGGALSARQVGWDYTDGMGTYEDGTVIDVLGGRWVWVAQSTSAAESADHSEYWFTDIHTGRRVTVVTEAEDGPTFEGVGLAGVFVAAGRDGILVLRPDGDMGLLSDKPSPIGLAGVGNRVYWQDEKGVAKTATVSLPRPEAPRTPPRARTIGRCKPRPGARLILHDGRFVYTRAGGKTWLCVNGRTREAPPELAADPNRREVASVGYPDPYTYWLDAAGAPHVVAGDR